MKSLQNLFLTELADMLDAEKRIAKALPKLVKAATDPGLRAAFEAHLQETEEHAATLEEVFVEFEMTPRREKCEAVEGLIKEADQIVSGNVGLPTINAALISAAQKIEHYEIASYGCLREWAEQLGQVTAASLLGEILDQERAADENLTELARNRCNVEAEMQIGS